MVDVEHVSYHEVCSGVVCAAAAHQTVQSEHLLQFRPLLPYLVLENYKATVHIFHKEQI